MEALYNTLCTAKPFFLIAGPCVIEDESLMMNTAEHLLNICQRLNIPLVFKSSFRKANRSHPSSPEGPGMEKGLELLARIKSSFGLPILTDVHETQDVTPVAEVCDILQIPAFLSRQTALITAAAQSGRIVNIKKGQFMAPEDMRSAADKAVNSGNSQVLLTERGASFGYHNLVVDFRSFPIMHHMNFPVVYDVTHSLQRPSQSITSGGNPEFAPMMAQAAIATGYVQGLFIETHPKPEVALSDSKTQLPLSQMEALLESCVQIANIVR